MKVLRSLALTLALLSPLAAAPVQAANYLPGIGAVSANPGSVTLAIAGRAGTPYRVLWLTGPYRLVVDLQGYWLGAPTSSIYIGSGLVQQIRAARHTGGVTRVVFDLTGPADLRADNRGGTLVFTVIPRGVATSVMPGPVYAIPGYPAPAPTLRPVPGYAGYPAYGFMPPVARVTPLPVMPPMAWGNPPPEQGRPMPMPTPQPYQVQTPDNTVPAPVPFSPEPLAEEEPFNPTMNTGPKPVFGSRVYAGGGAALSLSETYALGGSDTSVSTVPNGEFGYDQLFTPNIGMSVTGRLMGYTVKDADAAAVGFELLHKRDDMQFTAGLRGRFEVMPGFELMVQPQGVYRTLGVTSTAAGTPVGVQSFLTSGYSNFGGGLGFGLGYRVLEWLSLVGTGEFNYLVGSMTQTPVKTIMPLTNIGGGGEVRLDFGGFATSLGYKYTGFSGSDSFSQSWHGPYLTVGYAY